MKHSLEESYNCPLALFDRIDDVIFSVDSQPVIRYVNSAFEKVTRYTAQEIVGRHPDVAIEHENPPGEDSADAVWTHLLATGKSWDGKVTLRSREGNPIEGRGIYTPVLHENPQRNRIYVLVRITRQREILEHQLQLAQRMETMGSLMGGVAHDFNNILMAIMTSCSLAERKINRPDEAAEYLNEIQICTEKGTDLTKQLLAFSRREPMDPVAFDLNDSLHHLLPLLRRLCGENIRISLNLHPSIPPVWADPGQIEQVVLNLVINARDAMEEGGSLELETDNLLLDESAVRERPFVKPGDYVGLRVKDTGRGMDEHTLAHLYEPFFTTKPEGTGLGLATVYGIVKQSKGYIFAESKQGRGTVFTIALPRTNVPTQIIYNAQSDALLSKGHGTILLVEDEETLCVLMEKVLTDAGYDLLPARDGGEALTKAHFHKGPIDLLITDVVLPYLNGTEVAKKLLRHHPGMRVLYISGYLDDDRMQSDSPQPAQHYLQKPFSITTLLQRVQSIIGGNPGLSEGVGSEASDNPNCSP